MCWVEERNTSPEISLIIAFLFCGWNSTVENSIKDFASTSWECHVRFAAANRFGIFFGLFSPTWSWLSMGNLPEISRFISTSGCFFFFFSGDSIRPCLEDDDLWLLKNGKKGKGVSDSKQWLISFVDDVIFNGMSIWNLGYVTEYTHKYYIIHISGVHIYIYIHTYICIVVVGKHLSRWKQIQSLNHVEIRVAFKKKYVAHKLEMWLICFSMFFPYSWHNSWQYMNAAILG